MSTPHNRANPGDFAKTVLAAVLCMAAASGIAPLLFGFLMG